MTKFTMRKTDKRPSSATVNLTTNYIICIDVIYYIDVLCTMYYDDDI